MQPLTPHYREDNENGQIESALRTYLDTHYLQNLENLDRTNPKVLVVFSGGNAVGKTTLARKISRELGGVIIENDAVKREILAFRPALRDQPDRLNKLTWLYTLYIYAHIDRVTNNGLIVRDGIIDWYYDRVLPRFTQRDYRLFIIGYDISPQKAVKLIQNRGDTATVTQEKLFSLLDEHAYHSKRFRAEYTPNVLLNDETIFDHEGVLKKLRKFIESEQLNV